MKIAEPEPVNRDLLHKAKWVISTQLLTSVVVAVAFLLKGPWELLSALYGGFSSICITMLLLWGIRRASALAVHDPGKSMRILYIGAAQRFFLVLALLACGLAVFKLDPIALCVGFAVAQVSYLIGSRDRTRKSPGRNSQRQSV